MGKFKADLIVLVAGFCLNAAFMAMPVKAGETRFSPRGADDRTAEVLAAVKSGATLRFEKGEYHFRSPSKLEYSISNHDNPGSHRVFLPVTNVVFSGRLHIPQRSALGPARSTSPASRQKARARQTPRSRPSPRSCFREWDLDTILSGEAQVTVVIGAKVFILPITSGEKGLR